MLKLMILLLRLILLMDLSKGHQILHDVRERRELLTSSEILSTLYSTANGSSWPNKDNWLTGDPCPSGDWYGVSCSSSQLLALDLSSDDLNGPIPSQLGLLTSLKSFSLDSNTLSGSLPSQLGQLTGLTSLFMIYSNSFHGLIPSELGKMSLLKDRFYLYSNHLTGSIPSQIGQLNSLTSLFSISTNSLTGNIPSELGQLSQLTLGFYISFNSLTGSVPSQLGQLSLISYYYYIQRNDFCDNIPSEVTSLTDQLVNGWYDYTTGNSFGIPCCETIPAIYTCAPTASPTHNSDEMTLYEILGHLYENTEGESSWFYKKGWLNGQNPCPSGDWYGVSCSFSKLASLNLGANNLIGSIPSQLGLLTTMIAFHFNSNSLLGSIPSQLGQFTSLTSTFILYSNLLSGSIPSELGKLTLIEEFFNLDNNDFTGFIPSEIGQLTAISQYFMLSQNSFSGSIPSQLGQLTLITNTFLLYTNSFSGTIPSEMGMLTQLVESFYIYSNHLTGSVPSQIGQLNSLTSSFSISTNSLTGTIPSELGQLSQLTLGFYLSANSLIGTIPSELGQLSLISYYYYIQENQFCGDIPSEVNALTLTLASGYYAITPGNSFGTLCCETLPESFVCTPTTPPSLSPTTRCYSGTYYNSDENLCVDCDVGKYSSFSGVTFPSSCTDCVSGKYNTVSGSSTCTDCPSGKLSTPDRSQCKDCEAGEYSNVNNSACVECETGKYAPQALALSCLECTAGSHTNNQTKATSCTSCNAGTYSDDFSVDCASCSVGKYSLIGASSCVTCSVGSIANQLGSTTCVACDAGKYATTSNDSNCTDCPVGTYQSSTGQASCDDCVKGYYNDMVGATICSSCTVSKTSDDAASVCDKAISGYYIDESSNALACPDGALCFGGKVLPVPIVNYWSDRSDSSYLKYPNRCLRSTCKGGWNSQTEELDSPACWTEVNLTSSYLPCDNDNLMCKEGATGYLCGACTSGYSYWPSIYTCVKCSQSLVTIEFVLYFGFMILLFVLFMLIRDGTIHLSPWFESSILIKLIQHMDNGTLRVLFSTYQIIQSVTYTMDVIYPSPFSNFLDFLSFLNFEIQGLDCLGFNFISKVILFSIIPLFVILILLILVLLKFKKFKVIKNNKDLIVLRTTNHHHAKSLNSSLHKDHPYVWVILFISYLVLPPVTRVQFQSLDCYTMSNTDHASFLRVDASVDCNSPQYKHFVLLNGLLITIYLAIPLCWILFLKHSENNLFPTSVSDEFIIVYMRAHNPSLDHLRFLFECYRPHMVYWESIEMFRRILFISVVPLLGRTALQVGSIGLLFSLCSMIIYREVEPFNITTTNNLAYLAQLVILLVYGGSVVLETNMASGLSDLVFGLILFVVNLTVVVTAILVSWIKSSRAVREKMAKHVKLEDARGFSKEKFKTTFNSVVEHSIPQSHILVFYYSTKSSIEKCLKCGIFAHKDGIVFTLHHPHELDEADRGVFDGFEAFVACSVPMRLLSTLGDAVGRDVMEIGSSDGSGGGIEEKKKEISSSLCLLRLHILRAMRGRFFTDISDKEPWLAGILILPPTCLLRAYLYEDTQDEEEDIELSVLPIPKLTEHVAQFDEDYFLKKHHENIVVCPETVLEYTGRMTKVRDECDKSGLVPLYHYTQENVIPFILQGGFRMSTQGQGDGGVYFSTQSPASYGLGTEDYENNLIIDCFGIERLHEYQHQHKLDVCIVYGVEPSILDQAPGGRDNAKVVTKTTFEFLSLPDENLSYFLRPDRIMLVFILGASMDPPIISQESESALENEKNHDIIVQKSLVNHNVETSQYLKNLKFIIKYLEANRGRISRKSTSNSLSYKRSSSANNWFHMLSSPKHGLAERNMQFTARDVRNHHRPSLLSYFHKRTKSNIDNDKDEVQSTVLNSVLHDLERDSSDSIIQSLPAEEEEEEEEEEEGGDESGDTHCFGETESSTTFGKKRSFFEYTVSPRTSEALKNKPLENKETMNYNL